MHAIFASEIPIVKAVGHETDFTILCDFVAWRARSHTIGCRRNFLSPELSDLIALLKLLRLFASKQPQQKLHNTMQQLLHLSKRLRHFDTLREQQQN
ncbi:MAG: exodeoxyribonuclease VII large subunit [Pseudomonadales bacterium]